MRLVFAGTPATAVPTLDALLKSRHAVAAVITRPDAKSGRGQQMAGSPVAARAQQAGVEVLRPQRPADPEFLARLRQIGPDCCPVTAYGALIPQEALDIPVHGWVNLHFSILPAWRGAAPVQHAILHGDDVTGATTFRLVRELDAGPVFGVLTEAIRPSDTAGNLLDRLAVAGADLMVATLDGIESGELEAREQLSAGASRAPKITADDAKINWHQPAVAIGRLIRACTPEPGAWTELDGVRIKVWPLLPRAAGRGERRDADTRLAPGELVVHRDRVVAGTATGPVELSDVQQHGKRRMPAADWARGLRRGTHPAVLG